MLTVDRSPLPTYVLLSPLPFPSERSRNPTTAHSKLSWIDKTRNTEDILAIQGLRKADRLDSRPLAVPPMLRACRGLLLSTRSSPVALPRLPSPRASFRDTSTATPAARTLAPCVSSRYDYQANEGPWILTAAQLSPISLAASSFSVTLRTTTSICVCVRRAVSRVSD